MDKLVGKEEQKDFIIFLENKPIWMAFLMIQTQWVKDFGSHVSLNYPAVFTTWENMGIEKEQRQAFFEDLKIIEYAALSVLNK